MSEREVTKEQEAVTKRRKGWLWALCGVGILLGYLFVYPIAISLFWSALTAEQNAAFRRTSLYELFELSIFPLGWLIDHFRPYHDYFAWVYDTFNF